jgi:hypothetical protein
MQKKCGVWRKAKGLLAEELDELNCIYVSRIGGVAVSGAINE